MQKAIPMAKYLITYDYKNARDYTKLYQLLGQWQASPLLQSVWLANLNGTAGAVRDALESVGDSDDAFAVIELKAGSDWATTAGVRQVGADWLASNL
jgi:hypothetical protein